MDYKKDNMHELNNLDKINKPNELKKIVNKQINNISIIKTEINNNKEIVKSINRGSKQSSISF